MPDLFLSLVVGTAMIVATVVVETFVIAVAVTVIQRHVERLSRMHIFRRTLLMLTALSLWLLAGITAALWMWALLFVWLGEFSSIGPAIYFSSVTATTLGYGDIVLSPRWELLSGFTAANGLLLFSLNTAFLFEALRRLYETGAGGRGRAAVSKD